MKLVALVLASLVMSVAGIGAFAVGTAAEEGLACPAWICLYEDVEYDEETGQEGFRSAQCFDDCDTCCNQFAEGPPDCEYILGNPSCWCTDNPNMKDCPWK